MIATTYCRYCGQLVGVSTNSDKTLSVHFANVIDARPCRGSYESAFVNHPMKKPEPKADA